MECGGKGNEPQTNEQQEDHFRDQLISLESSLGKKERRVSELEDKLSSVQKDCKVYKKECKQLSRELRTSRQELRDYLRASKKCRIYERSLSCKCHCHKLLSVDRETQTFETDFRDVGSSSSALDWHPAEGSGLTVADMVQEAASSVAHSDYVYDEQSKMYYSVSTGYYYDPYQKLFYEPHSKTYYSYDENNTYHFHSQLTDSDNLSTKAKKRKSKKNKNVSDEMNDLEEGELNSCSSSTSLEDSMIVDELVSLSDNSDEENPDRYPPSMRLIVQKSEKLPVGSLLLVTCSGAQVGRTEEQEVYIPDSGISRIHAKIEYSSEKSCYVVSDLGSQNGTFLNAVRLSKPKVPNTENIDVKHGDKLTFANTVLSVHIHVGTNTCEMCEPGLLLQNEEKKPLHPILTKEEREAQRKEELRRLKKKYALSDYCTVKSENNYTDRAQQRRRDVGSSNPYEKDSEAASVDRPVSADNAGFKMLQRMGWQEGASLGKEGDGRKEPVNAYEDGQVGRAGLGTRVAVKEILETGKVQIVIVAGKTLKNP